MYIICYYSKDLRNNIWERISGEDAMHVRIDELCGSGLKSEDLLVFGEADELDAKTSHSEQTHADDEIKNICDILDISSALAGYKVMDGGADWIVIRNSHIDRDFEIKVTELP